jgi:hypothetical protein
MAELMDKRTATYHGKVVNHNLSGNLNGIRHDHVIAHYTVVSHMAVCHDQTVAAHYGLAFRCSPAVNCDTLSDHSVVSDYGYCILTLELKILRRT